MTCPCYAPTMPFFSRPQQSTAFGRRTCCAVGLEKNGIVGAWHGHVMASVNQTRPHCVNQMGKTHSKPLAARHGRETAWVRHGHGMLCVNRPLNPPYNYSPGSMLGNIKTRGVQERTSSNYPATLKLYTQQPDQIAKAGVSQTC